MLIKVKSSRMENGQEICNTCVRPIGEPFRYTDHKGQIRGCIASCHDVHIRRNTNPDWVGKTHYVLPKWITDARRSIVNFERFEA
jgi:hypothetical protein